MMELDMSIQLMTYHSLFGNQSKFKPVLVDDSGRKYFTVLMMEGTGLVTRKLPLSEERYLSPVIGKSKSISTVTKQFRSYGRRVGMTKAAKSFLTKASKAAK